jgi:hypothetical protein
MQLNNLRCCRQHKLCDLMVCFMNQDRGNRIYFNICVNYKSKNITELVIFISIFNLALGESINLIPYSFYCIQCHDVIHVFDYSDVYVNRISLSFMLPTVILKLSELFFCILELFEPSRTFLKHL